MALIIFLIILSVLVVVHEFGHFSVAKSFGIRVDEFGLGFPPRAKKIFSWKGTDFTLNWFPFGGFVKIFGENPDEDGLDTSSDSFQNKNRGIQALVLLAGVIGNLLLSWALFILGFLIGMPKEILGLESGPDVVRLSIFGAVVKGFVLTYEFTILISQAVGSFLLGVFSGSADFSMITGPIGLVSVVGDVSAMGFVYLLAFTAVISINLAVVNLLPIPALDGGRLIFVLIESVMRKSISPKILNYVNTTGFALLVLLMIFITFHDISGLF